MADIPIEDKKKLYGIAPLLVSSGKTVFVEGKDKSFDRQFYKALIDREGVDVQPLEACTDVIKAATHTGYWKHLPLGEIVVFGVIDKDYRTDKENADHVAKASGKLLSLKRHDVEAYMVEPALMARIATIVSGPVTDEAFYRNIVIEYARENMIDTVRSLTNHAFKLGHNLTLGKPDITGSDLNDLSNSYKSKRDEIIIEINSQSADDKIEAFVLQTGTRLQAAIDDQNIEQLLTYFKGKAILNRMLPHIGVGSKNQLAAIILDNNLVDKFSHLQELRSQIHNFIGD